MKVSDYIAKQLHAFGVRKVFMLTGGGAMHLNDSIGSFPKFDIMYNHHEQACAMAAESYGRLTNFPALLNVTTGPGGINALNGVFGAWTDSIPMIVVSGQVRYDTTMDFSHSSLRQMGDQEVDIISMVKKITKYSKMIKNPEDVPKELQKAFKISITGRKGPVWIDVPVNVQGAIIKNPKIFKPPKIAIMDKSSSKNISAVLKEIKNAKRPSVLVGNGIRFSDSISLLKKFISKVKIPVLTAWNAHDIIEENFKYYFGRPGTVGDRPGNLILQNSDLLIVLGSRLNIRQIGYNWQAFARESKIIMVDIDQNELEKHTLSIDYPIHDDLKSFLSRILKSELKDFKEKSDWISYCKDVKKKYPVFNPDYKKSKKVNPYYFMHELSHALKEKQVIVSADGTACVSAFQEIKIKKGQRLYTNSGCASMGYELPASIGAWQHDKKEIICIAGDGSIMMNIQELTTIAKNNMNIKIFILNNDGYHSIRQTQNNFFNRQVGCGPDSNLYFPEFSKISNSHDIEYFAIKHSKETKNIINKVLKKNNAVICEVFIDKNQEFAPKVSSFRDKDGKIYSRPLEDQAPFLDRDELKELMYISLTEESKK